MNEPVKIVECPRDAWQGMRTHIPAEVKAEHLRRLIAAGFRHIDAVSFVSPAAVPQMADSEEVLRALGPTESVEIIGIIVNQKGAERAIATGAVQTLGFPYSISAEFLKRNQNQTRQGAQKILEEISSLAHGTRIGVVAYVSMAFGNPYEEPWSVGALLNACEVLVAGSVRQISLADTVGLATPRQVEEVFAAASVAHPEVEFGVHLHARREDVAAKVQAAYEAGCRRFDAAIGGLGGCPFAQDELVGNLPTEVMLDVLAQLGADLPAVEISDALVHANEEIARTFGGTSNHVVEREAI